MKRSNSSQAYSKRLKPSVHIIDIKNKNINILNEDNITQKSASSAEDLVKCNKLDASKNSIAQIDSSYVQKSFAALEWVSLSENSLLELDGSVWKNNASLKFLNFSKNNIKCTSNLSDIPRSLTTLMANENSLVSISGLGHLSELTTLILSKNSLKNISSLGLNDLRMLRKLSLSHNKIDLIPLDIKNCVELQNLRLGHNLISAISPRLSLKSLKLLDLGNNKISRFQDIKQFLVQCPMLVNLNLQGNQLTQNDNYPEIVFKYLPKLDILDNQRADSYTLDLEKDLNEPKVDSSDFMLPRDHESDSEDDAISFNQLVEQSVKPSSVSRTGVVSVMESAETSTEEKENTIKISDMVSTDSAELFGGGSSAWD